MSKYFILVLILIVSCSSSRIEAPKTIEATKAPSPTAEKTVYAKPKYFCKNCNKNSAVPIIYGSPSSSLIDL